MVFYKEFGQREEEKKINPPKKLFFFFTADEITSLGSTIFMKKETPLLPLLCSPLRMSNDLRGICFHLIAVFFLLCSALFVQ